jgi:hypothetical protein
MVSIGKSGKSRELRKYEIAYNKCIKMGMKSRQCKKSIKTLKPKSKKRLVKSIRKSPRKSPRKNIRVKSKSRSRSLNPYQRFVRSESSKSIYKGRSVKSRMRAIAKKWRKSKC